MLIPRYIKIENNDYLSIAIKLNATKIAKYIIENSSDFVLRSIDSDNLKRIINKGYIKILKLLVPKYFNVNTYITFKKCDCKTFLDHAVELKNLKIVKYLVEKGANINSLSYCFNNGIFKNEIKIFHYLFKHQLNYDQLNYEFSECLFEYGVHTKKYDLIENIINKYGDSVIDYISGKYINYNNEYIMRNIFSKRKDILKSFVFNKYDIQKTFDNRNNLLNAFNSIKYNNENNYDDFQIVEDIKYEKRHQYICHLLIDDLIKNGEFYTLNYLMIKDIIIQSQEILYNNLYLIIDSEDRYKLLFLEKNFRMKLKDVKNNNNDDDNDNDDYKYDIIIKKEDMNIKSRSYIINNLNLLELLVDELNLKSHILENGVSLLSDCIENNNIIFTYYLIKLGISIKSFKNENDSLRSLIDIIYTNNLEYLNELKKLIKNGIIDGYTIISNKYVYFTVKSKNRDKLTFLEKEYGINIEEKKGTRNTLIIKNKLMSDLCLNLIQLFLYHFDLIHLQFENGYDLLTYSIKYKNYVLSKYLIEHRASMNTVNNHIEVIQSLINDINIYNLNDFEILNYFIDHGLDVNRKDNHNNTPLIYGILALNNLVINNLLDHHADVNCLKQINIDLALFKNILIYGKEEFIESIC